MASIACLVGEPLPPTSGRSFKKKSRIGEFVRTLHAGKQSHWAGRNATLKTYDLIIVRSGALFPVVGIEAFLQGIGPLPLTLLDRGFSSWRGLRSGWSLLICNQDCDNAQGNSELLVAQQAILPFLVNIQDVNLHVHLVTRR